MKMILGTKEELVVKSQNKGRCLKLGLVKCSQQNVSHCNQSVYLMSTSEGFIVVFSFSAPDFRNA